MLTAAVATLVVAVGAAPASAAVPCWKRLLNDWYDGRIDNAYPVSCYRAAIRNLPEDVKAYSSAREDINRALLAAIRDYGGTPPPGYLVQPDQPSPPHTDGGRQESPLVEDDEEEEVAVQRESRTAALRELSSDIGSNNVDSLPLPISVLAGIALLLFGAAFASWLTRRIQTRRVPVATSPGFRLKTGPEQGFFGLPASGPIRGVPCRVRSPPRHRPRLEDWMATAKDIGPRKPTLRSPVTPFSTRTRASASGATSRSRDATRSTRSSGRSATPSSPARTSRRSSRRASSSRSSGSRRRRTSSRRSTSAAVSAPPSARRVSSR